MREKDIEAYLVKRVKEVGGRAYKFVSPGNAGVPDRLVLLPLGRHVFVELKVPNGRLTPLQANQIEKITRLGHEVWVINHRDGVDEFMKLWRSRGWIE